MSLPPVILVALGAALGGAARHAVSHAMAPTDPRGFPWATVLINVSGCLLIGLLAPFILGGADHTVPEGREVWRWFALVGLLGGFTTFSTFGIESLRLIQQGLWGHAIGYVLVSVVGSLIATAVGWSISAAATAR